MTSKTTNGLNDRPIDTTIAQTGEGIPDDSGAPIDVSDEEVERIADKLKGETPRDKLKREVKEEIELPLKGSA